MKEKPIRDHEIYKVKYRRLFWLCPTSGVSGAWARQIRSVSDDRINPQNHLRTSDRGPHNRVECARAPFCADHRSDTEAANLISKQVRWLSFSFSQSADRANIQSRALQVPVFELPVCWCRTECSPNEVADQTLAEKGRTN